MADVANKYAENVAGAFYVDDQCIDCDLCRETAPASFKRNDDGVIPTFTSNQRPLRRKRSAKKRWKVAPSKRLAMAAQSYSRLCVMKRTTESLIQTQTNGQA